MKAPNELLRDSEERLNKALSDFESPPTSSLAKEFYELRVQAAVFNYDISYDMVAIWQSTPSGFAEKVALKNLIHKLYEYDQLMQKHLVIRMLTLARARHIDIESKDIKAERKKWSKQLVRLDAWSDLRNQATGHYGKNVTEQITLLKQINRKEVMDVVSAFLSYNIAILKVLAYAGQGKVET
ncbi:MAG: hypothetical protein ACKVN9_09560 [Methylophilaceae bacterium]